MRLSVVIVCFGGDVLPVLDELARQRRPGDEVLCVDNLASAGGTAGLRDHPCVDRLIEPAENLHYAAGANLGARAARGDAVVVLNPDAVPEPGCLDALRTPPEDWDAWSAVLTLPPDGGLINQGGGVVHFTGLAWAGRYGQPVTALPSEPYDAGFLTGGCLAMRRPAWEAMGGYAEGYGAYHEDTELSLRLRLAGRRFGFLPAARAIHDYDFDKGTAKWRFMEANRWRTLLRTYPAALLALLAPVLLAVELGIVAAAVAGGWLPSKLRAYGDLARWLPAMPAERRAVQATRRVSVRTFAQGLSGDLDSPFLGPVAHLPPVQAVVPRLWRLIVALLPR